MSDALKLAIDLRASLADRDVDATKELAERLVNELTGRRLRVARRLAERGVQLGDVSGAIATVVDDVFEESELQSSALQGPPEFTLVVRGTFEGPVGMSLHYGGTTHDERVRLFEWLLGSDPDITVVASRIIERFDAAPEIH